MPITAPQHGAGEVRSIRIAIAQDENRVSEHFGHCEGYAIFDAEESIIYRRDGLPNPGRLPVFLAEHGAGGLGAPRSCTPGRFAPGDRVLPEIRQWSRDSPVSTEDPRSNVSRKKKNVLV